MTVHRLGTAFVETLSATIQAAGGSAMKELVFALEFRGSAAPVPGSDKKLQAKTSATSQTLRSVLKAEGIQAAVEPAGAGSAIFESEVEIVGDGMFVESGTIKYGDAGKVSFRTVGRGTLGPSPLADVQRGAVMWEVTGGDGRLAGAQGLITSNFTVGATGDVVDDQFARLYIP
jgi:hypothetical protein